MQCTSCFCHKEQQNKNGTVFFVTLFRIFVPLSRFFTTVPFFHNGTKTEQCILYHCSVFLYHCSVFVPLFRFCTSVPFFALLFRFSTMGQKRNSVFCTTVPCFCTTVLFLYHCSVFALLFRFLHYCSVFPQRDKTEQCILYHRSLFLFHCSVFPLLFRFTTTDQCVFVPLFRFFFFALLFRFPTTDQKRNSVFCTTVPFFALLFCFFLNGTKKEQCILFHCSVFAPLFRFWHYCSVFSTTEQKRNSVFCTTVLCLCTTVPFFHYCSIFPQIEGTSHSVSRRQRNETFPNRKGNK